MDANGDVVFEGTDNHIYRYAAGTTTQLSQSEPNREESGPVTDGINTAYETGTSGDASSSLAVAGSGGETVLGPVASSGGFRLVDSPDYAVAGGWVAFEELTQPETATSPGEAQLDVVDPSGTRTTLIPPEAFSEQTGTPPPQISAMNSDGEVIADVFHSDGSGQVELVQAGASPILLPGPVLYPAHQYDWSAYIDGRWYEMADGSLNRLATDAPDTSITSSPPPAYTNHSSISFDFTASRSDVTFQCELDAQAWGACSGANSDDLTGLPDGPHTFSVRATDSAGDTDPNPPTISWTVKTKPPAVSLDSPTDGTLTDDATTNFSGTVGSAPGDEQEVTVKVYSGTDTSVPPVQTHSTSSAGSWSVSASPALADGQYTVVAEQSDQAGNTGVTSPVTFTVDATPPDVTLTSEPPDHSTNSSPSFSFSSSDPTATFACWLDGNGSTPCDSPKTYSKLADGTYTFNVVAVDPAGNETPRPAWFTFTVDTTPPDVTITGGPSGLISGASASFSFSSSDSTAGFECSLDGAAFAACVSPQAYSGLADGSHTFDVRGVDPVGNRTADPASGSFVVDTHPPDVTITSGPSGLTNNPSPSFSFSSSDSTATFECSLDSAAFTACTSPQTYSGLSDGSHTFQVRAVDQLGADSPTPASGSFVVDAHPPHTTISSGPPSTIETTSATFSFFSTVQGSTFECRLDSGGWSACSSPDSLTGLSDGSHSFQVRAIDPLGSVDQSPASETWTVDTSAPHTTISSGPANPTRSSSATLVFFSSRSQSTFQCQLDGGEWTDCSSPASYSGLGAGQHTFSVRARDGAGFVDPTPASTSWTVGSFLLTGDGLTVLTGSASGHRTAAPSIDLTHSTATVATAFCALKASRPCAISIVLTAPVRVPKTGHKASLARKPPPLTLGRRKLRIKPGQHAVLTVKLTRQARNALTKLKKIKVTASFALAGSRARTRLITLKVTRAKRGH